MTDVIYACCEHCAHDDDPAASPIETGVVAIDGHDDPCPEGCNDGEKVPDGR